MGGELLPAAPLQPCAGGPSERGHLFSGWVNLAPCNYFSNNVQACTGMGHPLGMVLCAEAPHPVGFYLVRGLLSEPCQYIPCPLLPTTYSCAFIVRHNINGTVKCKGVKQ